MATKSKVTTISNNKLVTAEAVLEVIGKPTKRIVVIEAGWVFMGMYRPATENTPAFVTDAACIRTWGTTAGLGEIALNGPTPNTVLEPCGVLLLDNPKAVLFTIPCQ